MSRTVGAGVVTLSPLGAYCFELTEPPRSLCPLTLFLEVSEDIASIPTLFCC